VKNTPHSKRPSLLFIITLVLLGVIYSFYACQAAHSDTTQKILSPDIKTLGDIYHALEKSRCDTNDRAVAWNDKQKDTSITFKQSKIFISLGMNCAIGFQLEAKKLVEAFFPFDWCISEFESIYRALETDFNGYLQKENLVVLDRPELAAHHYVRDTGYNIMYLHDFSLTGEPLHDYEEVKNKYHRRIARLYHVLTLNKKVYFLRTGITKEQAIQLNNLIARKFPKLKYTLVVIDQTEEYKKQWNIKRIKNFFLKDFQDPGMNSQELVDGWNALFKKITTTKNLKHKSKSKNKHKHKK